MILVLPTTLIGVLLCISLVLSIAYIAYCIYVERKKLKLVNSTISKVEKYDINALTKELYKRINERKRTQGVK